VKIKAKLLMGIGALFAMIALLIVLSSLFINKLSGETKNILVANYNTLDYSRQMLIAMNNGVENPESIKLFQENLTGQQNNITEPGEKELTDKLVVDFGKLKQTPAETTLLRIVQKDITDIMHLNMQAIQRKSSIAQS